jgi:2-alkenal reductase
MSEPVQPGDFSSRYSPPPEPRPTWSPEAWQAAQPNPWSGYAPPPPAPRPEPARGRTGGLVALVLVVALLAAGLASTGTYLALSASGALDRPAPVATGPAVANTAATPAGQRTVTLDEQSAIITAAAAVNPAVVTITVSSGTGGSQLDPYQLPTQGVGSGILYDASGWILTNRHVVEGGDNITVLLQDGRQFPGKTYGVDTYTDLAIVKIEGSDLPVARIGDSATLKQGQRIVAIGSPLGDFTNSVTAGVVSALGRSITVNDEQTGQPVRVRSLIQHDASINPGNSGGALVDVSGQVVGINTAVASTAQGIGFAIPINIAKPIMSEAVAGKELSRPWIGIYYTQLDPATAKELKSPVDYGALIQQPEGSTAPAVQPDSPAAKAGLEDGDIITKMDGQQIDAGRSLEDLLLAHNSGDTVQIEVLRDGQAVTVSLTLGTRPQAAQ